MWRLRRAPSPPSDDDEIDAPPAAPMGTPRNRPVPRGAANYSPFVEQRNLKEASKPRWNDTTPDMRKMVELGTDLYTSNIMVNNPFPNKATRVKTTDSEIVHAAQLLHLERRLQRLEQDKNYRDVVRKMVCQFFLCVDKSLADS